MLSATEGSQAFARVRSGADTTVVGPNPPVKEINSVQRKLVQLSAKRIVGREVLTANTLDSPVTKERRPD